MTLGRGTARQAVRENLIKILTITRGKSVSQVVGRSSSPRDGVDYAAPWLERIFCFFLADDLWPTPISDLYKLFRDCPKSRMAITARSITIP